MKKQLDNIAIIVLYFLSITIIAAIPYYIISAQTPGFQDPVYITAFFVTYATVFVTLGFFIFKELIKDFKGFTNKIFYNILIILGTFAFAFIVSAIAAIIIDLLGFSGGSENQGGLIDMVKYSEGYETIVLVLLFVLIVPIIEEIVFRKAIYGLVKFVSAKILQKQQFDLMPEQINKFAGISAVIFSGLIFGLVHIQGDYIYLLQYGTLGILIGFSYYLSKENIYVPLGIHIIQNVIATASIFALLAEGMI